jgi:hypothetical protein
MGLIMMIFSLYPALYVLAALIAPRSAIGHRPLVSDITKTVTNGLKMATAGDVLRGDASFASKDLMSFGPPVAVTLTVLD